MSRCTTRACPICQLLMKSLMEITLRLIFESPIMSTYVVGVVVGVFDYIEDTSAEMFCRGKSSCILPCWEE
ncbi:hypothetical protein PanWU01x14_024210 [Parasponia andersonii]|uniref:Uncharacterized protein n=1 Tax=Parasponia andersonii TaxID=3476 RepID=A0A2P5DWK3_PARAD|nr:hypothetical protein PanWU01x14_024210 [Parasponia andersonii]